MRMKFSMRKQFYAVIILYVFSVLGGAAQLEDTISVAFRCLSLGSPIRENLYAQQSGGKPIRIYSNQRTDRIIYNGPNPITFYREVEGEDGQEVRVPVGRFKFVEGVSVPLLLFSRVAQDKEFYNITAIDDGLAAAPPGSYRIFNFTKKDIAGIIGSQQFRTAPGNDALIRDTEQKAVDVMVRLAEKAENGPERLYASTWAYSPRFRYLVFIVPTTDRTRGNIKIRKISDRVSES